LPLLKFQPSYICGIFGTEVKDHAEDTCWQEKLDEIGTRL